MGSHHELCSLTLLLALVSTNVINVKSFDVNNFFLGGSIAVGAHGITTDVPVSESVLWVKLVDAQGCVQRIQKGDDEMKYVLGGYGI